MKLETLQTAGAHKVTGEKEILQHVNEVRNLASAMRFQLIKHQIDVNPDSPKSKKDRNYGAYFKVPGENAVFSLNSLGAPETEEVGGLFLFIFERRKVEGEEKFIPLMRIQTDKSPALVNRDRALANSLYTAEQLHVAADIVRKGVPISPDEYQAFFEQS